MISYHNGRVSVWPGDCREVLAGFDPDQFDACVTDPPYHLTGLTKPRYDLDNYDNGKGNPFARRQAAMKGFMGKAWDGGDVAFQPETWAAVLRVLKPGAHLVAFAGTRTYHRMACAIEDVGFEVRDAIMWHYGSGFPKSHDISKAIDRANGHWRGRAGDYTRAGKSFGQEYKRTDKGEPITAAAAAWSGWGTALKPATEIICLARKPLSEPTVAANVLRWGTGAINISACRVPTDVPRPCLERRKDAGLDATRNTYGTGINGSRAIEPTTLGRWPANLVHDGSDEVVSGFPVNDANGYRENESNQTGAIFGNANGVVRGERGHDDSGSAARFFATFPQAKVSAGKGMAFFNDGVPKENIGIRDFGDRGSASRYFYTAKADSDDRIGSKHPTVKPVDLIQWLCRLITPPRGLILDPFAGTGTTAEAALHEGFRSTLIEREAEYLADIDRRMALVFEGAVGRSVAMAKLKPEGDPLPLFPDLP